MAIQPNYDKFIAEAAKELVLAKMDNDLQRTEATHEAFHEAENKLWWMVEAPKHGWNPEEYEPET